ncbi:MAG: hypothetical protein AVO35_07000 [Candidatus Aegiribacteria sp. MLS_C]|nr:MAG: hypothetical protein AVO35_07000 [Candidatus Aegiribacteria sp. MLS_C]
MRVAIVGGGTGGHISPAIAVAEALEETVPGVAISFISTPRPVDARMYEGYGDAVHILDPPRIDRGLRDLLPLPFRAVRTYRNARKLLRELEPSVLFATGGYPSFFPVIAARRMGIPSAIHESNSIPGRTSRMTARRVDLVMTGFKSASSRFRGEVIHTGNPVRQSLVRHARSEARARLGIPEEGPAVLFLGGSQGARALNDLALQVPDGVSLILQCGTRDLERVRRNASELGIRRDRAMIVDFTDDPALLYSAVDLAVARSGAMTVAELAWFRVPAVYIPYPFATEDHQRWNAMEMVEGGGALMMDQEGLEPEALWKSVRTLLSSDVKLQGMRDSLSGMMPENPAVTIAGILAGMAGRGRNDGP